MIRERLDDIRKKPKEVRAQYAFAAAGVCTALLAVLWATTLPARFAVENVDPTIADRIEAEKAAQAAAPEERGGIATLLGTLRDGMAALIFNTKDESSPTVVDEDAPKTIDIDALLLESAATQPSDVSDTNLASGTSSSTAGSATTTATSTSPTATTTPPAPAAGEVILIGTTTKSAEPTP